MRYFGDLNLMALNGAEIIDHETVDGGIVRGVFIPLEENGLRYYVRGNNLSYFMDITECRPNPEGYTHNIKPYVRKADRQAFRERYGTVYVGKLKPQMSEMKRIYNPDVDDILGLRQVDTGDPKYSVCYQHSMDTVREKIKEREERKARRAARRAERERRRQERLKQQENGPEKE